MAFSQKVIATRFAYFAKACGKRIATSYKDAGAWRLDYNPAYGGYNIEEIRNAQGGITQPFGIGRMKAAAFMEAMRFAEYALRARGGSSGSARRRSSARSRFTRRG